MYLKQLSLINFKNFEAFDFSPSQRINCFIGDNGVGKTTLLDSIHYLSFCKSFINPTDKLHIKESKDFFVIDGIFNREDNEEKIYCAMDTNKGKSFRKNGSEYKKLSEHIGFIPLVYTSPSDINLIHGGSDLRRKFVNSVISQFDKKYLNALIAYNKALEQRNNLLKNLKDYKKIDYDSIEVWDMQLVEYGNIIHRSRLNFKQDINDIFQNYYNLISGGKEKVQLYYKSQLEKDSFDKLLSQSIDKDRYLGYTGTGIHRDDFEFVLNGFPLKKYGSQGQQKTYIISLKLSQFDYIKKNTNLAPILLLDDIFDKLDNKRVTNITNLASENGFGQIFITDTSYERMPNILKNINIDNKLHNLSE